MLSKPELQRVIAFGDNLGLPQTLRHVPTANIAAVVGAAIRPAQHSAIAELAASIARPFLVQPSFNSPEYTNFVSQCAAMQPDGIICNSYSMLLRPDMLALVEGRAFNLHASLLPENPGPNPMQWAIIKGQEVTGVTLHRMDTGFDTGPIIAQKKVIIEYRDDWLTLKDKIFEATEDLLAENVTALLTGRYQEFPQPVILPPNPRISPDSFAINWQEMSDWDIYNLIRAQVTPLAGAYLVVDDGSVRRFPKMLSLNEIATLRAQYCR